MLVGKHVEGGRINPSQRSYLQSLSPWHLAALLGEMADAGVTNAGEGERWLEARRDARHHRLDRAEGA